MGDSRLEFRAWLSWLDDEKECRIGEMVYSEFKEYKRHLGFVIYSDMIQNSQLSSEFKCDWMQYTGLKDKNGKKIFSGDKLRFDKAYFSKDVFVRFSSGSFNVYNPDCCEYCKDGSGCIMSLYEAISCSHDDVEIIGNIHSGG